MKQRKMRHKSPPEMAGKQKAALEKIGLPEDVRVTHSEENNPHDG